jgi:hypothetical protein
LDAGKIPVIYMSKADSGMMIFQNHRRVPVSVFRVKIAASGPLKLFLEGF